MISNFRPTNDDRLTVEQCCRGSKHPNISCNKQKTNPMMIAGDKDKKELDAIEICSYTPSGTGGDLERIDHLKNMAALFPSKSLSKIISPLVKIFNIPSIKFNWNSPKLLFLPSQSFEEKPPFIKILERMAEFFLPGYF